MKSKAIVTLIAAFGLLQLPAMAEMQNSLQSKCPDLYSTWAKTYPTAAAELQRRQTMHQAWTKQYPDASNALKTNMKSIMDWANAHPTEENQIMQFKRNCFSRLQRQP